MALSLVDRFALSLLFQPIKLELQVSDAALGLLHGVAFGLFYAFMSVPLGLAVDRLSRKWVIFWGVVAWSVMTALCGLASGYAMLLLARIGVGIGEAALAPAGYSIIADTVPRRQLGRAISVFQMGSVMGGGLSLVAGGLLYGAAQAWDFGGWPVLDGLSAWRLTFVALGVFGVVFALLVLLLREPRRSVQPATGDVRGVLAFLRADPKLWGFLFVGNACLVSLSYASLTWMPSVLVREYGWSPSNAGFNMGIAMLVAAPVGVFLGGWLADRWQAREGAAGYVRVLRWCPVLAAPFVLLPQFVDTPDLQVYLTMGLQFAIGLVVGVGPALIQLLAPPLLRGRTSAIYVLVVNLIGLGVGPVVIGLLSDALAGGDGAMLRALGGYSLAMLVVAYVAIRKLRQHLQSTSFAT